MYMPTYIHGIAASENIDSSGERLIIAGLDISSLDKDGIFNYEHKNDNPNQVIGKILKAKRIFQEQDCEDEHQLYFWSKIQTPYLYVMGELFDDFKESAKEVAGMFQYDQAKRDQNERNVMNFSIEGAKIEKRGIDIVKSIARKVTITVLPCNKAAVAEMIPAAQKTKKDSLDSIFKSENAVEILLFKTESTPVENLEKHAEALGISPMKKGDVLPFRQKGSPDPRGSSMGRTSSGKEVFSHSKIHEYKGFDAADHTEASRMHYDASQNSKDHKTASHHRQKMNLHNQAIRTAERKQNRMGEAKKQRLGEIADRGLKQQVMGKAMDAGSANVAPSELSGTAALQKESGNMSRPDKGFGAIIHKPGAPAPKGFGKIIRKEEKIVGPAGPDAKGHLTGGANIVKTKWLARAEEAYTSWNQREKFQAFMKSRFPKMTMGEIDAFGQTLALKKSLDAEKSLTNLVKGECKCGGNCRCKK